MTFINKIYISSLDILLIKLKRYHKIRNHLILSVSSDLRHWRKVMPVMTDDTGLEPEQSKLFTGFQYVDWLFDGPDIIYLVRAAYRGAHNYHDSNRILFRRMTDYQQFLKGCRP